MDEQPQQKTTEVLNALAERPAPMPSLRKDRDGFNRMDVVNAFSNAFQMIGGVPRLALWANQHPDKFYPLFAKLMPSTAIQINAEGNTIIIEHAIPTTDLDKHPSQNPGSAE